eukprot:10973656-Ditylum_brightwellii.AAC.1
MAAAWMWQDKPRGVFVPARAELIASLATFKQLLQNRNMYIDSITSVTIEGLYLMALEKEIAVGTEKVSIKE